MKKETLLILPLVACITVFATFLFTELDIQEIKKELKAVNK